MDGYKGTLLIRKVVHKPHWLLLPVRSHLQNGLPEIPASQVFLRNQQISLRSYPDGIQRCVRLLLCMPSYLQILTGNTAEHLHTHSIQCWHLLSGIHHPTFHLCNLKHISFRSGYNQILCLTSQSVSFPL